MAPKAPQLNRVGITPMEWEAEGAVNQGDALILGTAPGQLKASTAITDVVVGVAEHAAASGSRVSVTMAHPVAIMRAEGTIAYGAQVVPKATGPGTIVTATAIGATGRSCGIHLGAECASGDKVPVLLVTTVNGPPNS